MRRESYELTVGKPQVVTKTIDGKIHEPVERLTIDSPDEYHGRDHPRCCPLRKGRMEAADQPRYGLAADGVRWSRRAA